MSKEQEKLSRTEISTLKNKVKLWCGLHGVSIGNRYENESAGAPLKYLDACRKCREMNGDRCPAYKSELKDKKLLLLDVKNWKLYQLIPEKAIPKAGRGYSVRLHQQFIWCVEWIKYV